MNKNTNDDGLDRLLSIADVCRILGRSRAGIHRDIQTGTGPKQVKASKSSRWRISDLRAFLAALPRG